jgi:hypothetical protein
MRMSSKYTTIKELVKGHKMSSINLMKVVGEFIKPKTLFRLESFLPYISLFYGDLMVVKIQINITKVLGPLDLFNKVINSGNWVPIPIYDFVRGFVINENSP